MQDLMKEFEETQSELDLALGRYRFNIEKEADCEYKYRIAKSKKMLKLREEGMPATLILEVANGDEEIAQLRKERDYAAGMVEANKEAINIKKIELNGIRDALNREWNSQ